MSQKESKWEKEFDKEFNCFNPGQELVGTLINDLIKSFIRETISQREKEIAEEVEALAVFYPDIGVHDIEEDEELVPKKKVLQIIKH